MTDKQRELATVYTASTEAQAELVRQHLEANQISAHVSGSNQGGLTGSSLIRVEVLVFKDELSKAEKVIEAMDHE